MGRLIIFILLSGDIFSYGAASFSPSVHLVENGGALGSASGDLNDDGHFEFVSAASRSSDNPHFRIYEWNGTDFSIYNILSPSDVLTREDRFGGDLSIADIDGDGVKDIVVPGSNNSAGTGKVSWFKNPGFFGDVWRETVVSTWSGSGAGNIADHLCDIVTGDINNDGQEDIVVRDVSHGFWVMIQISGGTNWYPKRFQPSNPREGLALWDPDADGDMDILLNGVWFETPPDPFNENFIKRSIIGAEAWYPESNTSDTIQDYACQVETADFNKDGRVDFVISNAEKLANAPSTASKPRGIRVFLSPNDPVNERWSEVVLHTNHFSWHSCEIGDFDKDGDLDVISGISSVGVEGTAGHVEAFLNDGSGTVFFRQTISTNELVYNCSVGDADRDGDLDLFAPNNWNNGPIRFFKNTAGLVAEPKLKIVRQGTNIIVSWSIELSSHVLQVASPLDFSINWTDYPGPFATNGSTIVITNNLENSCFYRLKP